MLDAGGAPIQLDRRGGAPTISRDGMITQNGGRSARSACSCIDARRQADPRRQFRRHPRQAGTAGARLHRATASSRAPSRAPTSIRSEMTKLIAVTRAFDGVASRGTQTETSLQDAIKTLGGAA